VTYEILETYKIGEKPQVTDAGKPSSAPSTVKGQGEKV
jgi:sarcosine oxidase subunit delta